MKKIIIFLIALISLLYSQNSDGVGLSLAGNYMAMSRGVNAIAWNPANLALARGNTMELNLVSLNMSIGNNSINLNTYNRYFTAEGNNGYWSNGDKHAILDMISDDGPRTDFDLSANILGLAFNNFGLAVQMIGKGYAQVGTDKKPFQIALFGETIDHAYEYDQPTQALGASYSAMKVSIAYAYPVPMKWLHPQLRNLSIGAAWNQYVGIAVAQIREASVHLKRIDGEKESVEYAVALRGRIAIPESATPTGKGVGFDLGLSGGYGNKIDFALSIANIGASINWSRHTQQVQIEHADSLRVFGNDNDPFREISIDTSYDINSFSTNLPSVLRLGGVYHLKPNWKVSAEYDQGLNKAFGNSTTPRFGVATEYYLTSWLPLRGGMAVGGNDGFELGLGFGLHAPFIHFDYSYAMRSALWPTYSRGIYTAFSLKIVL